ncbi:hypothetical protein BMI88_08130 [Thioclava sp. F36-6]|nr:hypothetical protein BMI88_08130 [Thioclava sp. F36-6]
MRKIVLFAMLCNPAAAAYAQPDEWVVNADQAECILKHVADYKSMQTPVIIIHVASCPDPSPFAGATSGKSNFGGVSKIESTGESSDVDEVITFSAKDFDCLSEEVVRVENGLAFLPKRPKCGQ